MLSPNDSHLPIMQLQRAYQVRLPQSHGMQYPSWRAAGRTDGQPTGCCRPHASKSINKVFGAFYLERLDFFGIKSLLRIWQKRSNFCFLKFLTSSHHKMYQSKACLPWPSFATPGMITLCDIFNNCGHSTGYGTNSWTDFFKNMKML